MQANGPLQVLTNVLTDYRKTRNVQLSKARSPVREFLSASELRALFFAQGNARAK